MAFWKKRRTNASIVDALHPAESTDATAWVRDGLLPGDLSQGTRFGDIVPAGFDAYARVMHAVPTPDGVETWAHVADITGRTAHPTMQWPALAFPAEEGRPATVVGDGPPKGVLPTEQASALVDVLSIHTSTSDTCFFAFCTDQPGMPATTAPAFDHGRREHVLFTGDVSAAARPTVVTGTGDPAVPHVSPHLWWPADHAWIVGTDPDFRSTIVAAPRACVDQLLSDPVLEVYEVAANDRADLGGDAINPLPPSLAHLFS